MPQKDSYHDSVRNALEKDGWIVTHDPLTLRLEDVKFYVDIAAEKVVEPAKKVAIEIKVFGGLSFLNEFEKAVGQILDLRTISARIISRTSLVFSRFTRYFRRIFFASVNPRSCFKTRH